MDRRPDAPAQPDRFDDLRRDLHAATEWDGPETDLWRRALERTAGDDRPIPFTTKLRRLATRRPEAVAAGLGGLLLVGVGLLATLGDVGGVARVFRGGSTASSESGGPTAGQRPRTRAPALGAADPAIVDWNDGEGAVGRLAAPAPPPVAAPRDAHADALETSAAQRVIVRRVDLEILAEDVALAFERAARIPVAARGEFVAESSLSGADERPTGTITLRVVAARLGEVQAALREIGEVALERTSADDVSEQVVDLEARLANERTAERELRDLLAGREGAVLADVMEVRASLSRVRGEIERLTAQRDRLSDLAALATIRVLITRSPEPAPDEGASIWSVFGDELGGAWRTGQVRLAEHLAWIVRAAVGGLIWWAIVALAIGGGVRLARKRRAADRPMQPA